MGIMKYGVAAALEAEANRLLRDSIKDVKSHSEKRDILTPWKEAERHRREVLVRSGIPDPSRRQGMFHRAVNLEMPHLNSRDGLAGLAPQRQPEGHTEGSTLASFVAEHHLRFDSTGD